MSELKWEVKSQGIIALSGDLTRQTLLPLWQQRQRLIAQAQTNQQLCWDLSQIQHLDSAGFACLCELLVTSRQSGISVKIVHLPQQCQTLAELFDLTDLLHTFY